MHWISRVITASMASTLAIGVASVALIESRFHRLVEWVFEPAFLLGRLVTPAEWQFQGNIALGLGWLAFGISLYGVLLGLAVVVVFDLIKGGLGPRPQVEAGTNAADHGGRPQLR